MNMILGIIAGMGPFAATYFMKRVLQLTPAKKEWDHFRMFADYNVFIPSRTRSLLYGEESPAPKMIETINGLEKAGADLIAVPCNSGHGWYEEVSKQINIPWLNLIEVTSEAAKKRGVDKPLVVGAYVTVTKQVYDKYLDNVIYLTESEREKVYDIIERLKIDEDKDVIKKEFYEIVKPYKDKVDGIIIACTEPSMLFDINETEWKSFQIIDSTNEYAKRCVEVCKGITL